MRVIGIGERYFIATGEVEAYDFLPYLLNSKNRQLSI